jgi:hypothetical protein
VPIRVSSPGGRDGDGWSHGVDERLRRGGPATVMRHLEEVDARQALGEERRVDAILDIAHQQEPAGPDVTEEDDRHVVDARPAVRRRHRHLTADRPQDPEVDIVHGEAVTGGDREPDRRGRCGQLSQPGCVTRAGAAHPRFEDAGDVVALEKQGKTGDVILVRVGQDQCVDASVPWRDAAVERDEQAVGIGAAIDQEPTAARALDEDRIALSDIEDRHAR